MEIVNIELLKQPLNWFIVILMIVIAGAGLDVVLNRLSSDK